MAQFQITFIGRHFAPPFCGRWRGSALGRPGGGYPAPLSGRVLAALPDPPDPQCAGRMPQAVTRRAEAPVAGVVYRPRPGDCPHPT